MGRSEGREGKGLGEPGSWTQKGVEMAEGGVTKWESDERRELRPAVGAAAARGLPRAPGPGGAESGAKKGKEYGKESEAKPL